MGSDFLTEKTSRAAAFRINCNLSIPDQKYRRVRNCNNLAYHEGVNKGQQGRIRERTPYTAYLTECCEASFDGRGYVSLHRSVGIYIDAQITYGRTGNTAVLFIRIAPVRMRCRHRRDEHQSTSVFTGLSDSQLALIHDDTSPTQADTLSQRLSTADG